VELRRRRRSTFHYVKNWFISGIYKLFFGKD